MRFAPAARSAITLVLALVVAACADARREPDAGPIVTTPPPAPSCTRDAQVSIFRPVDFAQLANRSKLVVLGLVASQAVDVSKFGEAGELVVTWVDSTIAVERVLHASNGEPHVSPVRLRTMAEGRTCDLYDAIPVQGMRYVFFFDTIETTRDVDPLYYTVGGSWAGRLVVSGEGLVNESPAGRQPSRAATEAAAIGLSSLPDAIESARTKR